MIDPRVPSEALLPCPCCGAMPCLVDFGGWEVICDCGLQYCNDPGKDKCVAGWNRRAQLAQAEPVAEVLYAGILDAQQRRLQFIVVKEQLPDHTKLYAAPPCAEHDRLAQCDVDQFYGLTHLVQYRRRDIVGSWINMAAFDSERVANRYATECSKGKIPWEYRAIPAAAPESEERKP